MVSKSAKTCFGVIFQSIFFKKLKGRIYVVIRKSKSEEKKQGSGLLITNFASDDFLFLSTKWINLDPYNPCKDRNI